MLLSTSVVSLGGVSGSGVVGVGNSRVTFHRVDPLSHNEGPNTGGVRLFFQPH